MNLERQTDLTNKLRYVQKSSDNIEYHLRNSIPVKMLMQNEADGLGDITISQLLDVLQDLYMSGQVDSYEVLKKRKKPVK